MASKAKVATNLRRKKLAAKYSERRAELVKKVKSADTSPEEHAQALRDLQALPRNSSPTRVRNRCVASGRPRGYYRKFGLSRIALRELGLRGEVPGLTKASW